MTGATRVMNGVVETFYFNEIETRSRSATGKLLQEVGLLSALTPRRGQQNHRQTDVVSSAAAINSLFVCRGVVQLEVVPVICTRQAQSRPQVYR